MSSDARARSAGTPARSFDARRAGPPRFPARPRSRPPHTLPTRPYPPLPPPHSYALARGSHGGLEFVVLELSPVSHMDAMGAAFFEELHATYSARSIQLVRRHLQGGVFAFALS